MDTSNTVCPSRCASKLPPWSIPLAHTRTYRTVRTPGTQPLSQRKTRTGRSIPPATHSPPRRARAQNVRPRGYWTHRGLECGLVRFARRHVEAQVLEVGVGLHSVLAETTLAPVPDTVHVVTRAVEVIVRDWGLAIHGDRKRLLFLRRRFRHLRRFRHRRCCANRLALHSHTLRLLADRPLRKELFSSYRLFSRPSARAVQGLREPVPSMGACIIPPETAPRAAAYCYALAATACGQVLTPKNAVTHEARTIAPGEGGERSGAPGTCAAERAARFWIDLAGFFSRRVKPAGTRAGPVIVTATRHATPRAARAMERASRRRLPRDNAATSTISADLCQATLHDRQPISINQPRNKNSTIICTDTSGRNILLNLGYLLLMDIN